MPGVFFAKQPATSGWTGLGAICAVDPRSGGGRVVDRRRGPGPLVHSGPSQGGFTPSNLDRWLRDQCLRTSTRARRRRTAGSWRRPSGTSPEVRQRTQTRARDHGFVRGLVLREAGATGKLIGWLRRRLRRPWWLAPRGGGSPAASEWRHALWLGTKEKEGGEEFLTARRSFGGRGNDEEDDGGGDRRRRPIPMGGGGELGLAQKRQQGGG
jgi:hypothetical protein